MIKSIRLQNWRSHADTTLEFREGTNLLVGAMGSGKSSVMDGISFALFGTFPALERRKIRLTDIFRLNEDSASASLSFSWNGSEFRAERKIERKNNKAETSAKVFRDNAMVESGAVAATEYIESLLGVDYDLFSRAVYSEQNNMDYFLTLDPRKRKAELDALLGLDRFEEARANTISLINRIRQNRKLLETRFDSKKLSDSKEKLSQSLSAQQELSANLDSLEKSATKKAVQLQATRSEFEALLAKKARFDQLTKENLMAQATIAQLEGQIKGKEFDGAEALRIKKSLEDATEKKSALSREIRECDNLISSVSKEIGSCEAKIKKTESDENKLLLLKAELEGILKGVQIESLSCGKEEAEKEAISLLSEKKSLDASIHETQEMLSNIKPGLSICPVCDNPLGEKGAIHIIEEKNRKISEQKSKIEGLSRQIESKRKSYLELSKKIKSAESLIQAIGALEQEVRGKPGLERRLTEQGEKMASALLSKETLAKSKEELERTISACTLRSREMQEIAEKKNQLHGLLAKFDSASKSLADLRFNETAFEEKRKQAEEERVVLEREQSGASSCKKQLAMQKQITIQLEKEASDLEATGSRIRRYADLEEQLLMFKNALLETQTSMREGLGDAINAAMSEIWAIFYPYGNYQGIRLLATDRDYLFELQGQGGWKSLESVASGGERACAALTLRVALAMVLTPNLSWLILDEPTHNLDTEAILLLSETLQGRVPEVVSQAFVITHEEGLMGAEFSSSYRLARNKEEAGATKTEVV